MKTLIVGLIATVTTIVVLMNIAATAATVSTAPTTTIVEMNYDSPSWGEWVFGTDRTCEGYHVAFLEDIEDLATRAVSQYVAGEFYSKNWRAISDVEVRDMIFAMKSLRDAEAGTYFPAPLGTGVPIVLEIVDNVHTLRYSYAVLFSNESQAEMLDQCTTSEEVKAVRDFIPGAGAGIITISIKVPAPAADLTYLTYLEENVSISFPE